MRPTHVPGSDLDAYKVSLVPKMTYYVSGGTFLTHKSSSTYFLAAAAAVGRQHGRPPVTR